MRNILFLFHDFKLYYLNHIIKQKTDGGILRSFRSGRRDWNRLWNPAEKNLSAIVRSSERRKKGKMKICFIPALPDKTAQSLLKTFAEWMTE